MQTADSERTFGAKQPQPEPLLPSLVYAELSPTTLLARVGYNLPLKIGAINRLPWAVNYDGLRYSVRQAGVRLATPNVVDLSLNSPGFGQAGRYVEYLPPPLSFRDPYDRDMPHIYRYPIVIPS